MVDRIGLDFYPYELKFCLQKTNTLVGGFLYLGKKFNYTCRNTLLHLRKILRLWEDMITLGVNAHKLLDYYTFWV